MKNLGGKYGGKIVCWGEIDRRHIMPLGAAAIYMPPWIGGQAACDELLCVASSAIVEVL